MTRARLVALFALGAVLLHPPLLTAASREATVGGVPVLVAYLFAAWCGLIVACAVVMERGEA
jgi:hypothetical protein